MDFKRRSASSASQTFICSRIPVTDRTMKHAGRYKLIKKKAKAAEANIKALSYRRRKEMHDRRKEMYAWLEVDVKSTHSRFTAVSGKYGLCDLHVDAHYKTVLKNIARAGEGLRHEIDDALSKWHAAMCASLGRYASHWRNGE